MAFGFGFGLPMGGNPQWSPASLFYQSEPGAWYDPSDLSTLYQDQAGTTPVTAVEQSVGLMLDKSKGLVLGSELVTNGDFSNGTTGWTARNSASLSVSSGQLSIIDNGSGGVAQAVQSVTTVVGKTYRIFFNFIYVSVRGTVYIGTFTGGNNLGSSSPAPMTVSTSQSIYFTATTTTTFITLGNFDNGLGFESRFDNISVRELPGNHAYTPSASATSRPVLSARYNLLTTTETGTSWEPDSTTFATGLPGVSGSTSGSFSFSNTSGGTFYPRANVNVASGVEVTCSVWLSVSTGTVAVRPASYYNGAWQLLGSGNLTLTTTPQRFSWAYTPTTATSFGSGLTLRCVYSGGSGTVVVSGADLRVSNEPSTLPYQRVSTSTDYDTVGFPLYLKADGVDDYMQTNSIAFAATDKMTVWAGVRKLSDAATGMVTELSSNLNSNNGGFYLTAPTGASASNFQFASKGTTANSANPTGYTAPISAVLSMATSITPPSLAVKANGVALPISTSDQGTGNFGNYPLYLFRRGGSSVPFNGRFYGMTVLGAAATTNQIVQGETYLNQKMGLVY